MAAIGDVTGDDALRRLWARFGSGLSRELWLVQIGIFVNAFGWGAVLPFEVIYLHEQRGFPLATAGLIVGMLTGLAVLAAPVAGWLIDRVGARAVAVGAGVALALGYAGLASATSEPLAFVAAAIAGVGNAALLPAQSTLLASLAPGDRRHRATAVSRVATNAGFGLGGALGGLVAGLGIEGYAALFLLNAVTYLVYVAVLVAVVRHPVRPEPVAGGYRRVLRDGAFVRLAAANVAVIAVGWGVLPWVIPPYATSTLGVGPELIGLLFLANAATVVVAQMPIASAAEGRHRTVTMATGAGLIAAACVVVLVGTSIMPSAYPALLAASIVIGLGECFHTSALMPLVADLAPEGLRGRYMATMGLSWWIGLWLAPTVGTLLLGRSAALTFIASSAVAAAAAIALLSLEPRLPPSARLTPRPQPSAWSR